MTPLLHRPATARSRIAAGVLALAMLALAMVILPRADTPLAQVAPFLPMFATAVLLLEGMTAYLLGMQFSLQRDPFLGMLSGAYGFVAVIAIAQLLVFPRVFSDSGLLGAGSQSAVWLWTFWHAGYPLLVLVALAAWTQRHASHNSPGWQRAGATIMWGGPLLAVGLLWLVIQEDGQLLPPLIRGDGYQRLSASPIAWLVMVPNLLALVACVLLTRLRSLLVLWLAVAVLASLIDSMITLMATERYSLGWYLARVISLVASTSVLLVLLWETGRTYRRVMEQNVELTSKALRDGLTSAYNRRHLDDTLPRLIAQAKRKRQPVSLLLFDVDHFKAFNDSQGHVAGDDCLVRVTDAAHRALKRPLDLLARYGGEEFCVLLPDTDAQGAEQVAEAVRAEIEGEGIARDDQHGPVITVSVGVTCLAPNSPKTSAAALLELADRALYQAKRDGRNCVRVESALSIQAVV